MSQPSTELFLSRTTLRQIEIMHALDHHGSMSKAAKALGMSVANVSRVSKRFETNLNVQLFEGDGRRRVLRKEARDILGLFKALHNTIEDLRPRIERLRIEA
ncbi:helix-turn-helix domain-containing protein [Porphyrobacter sp. CACIAM 03H1]|uniref:helix-turn-helix domain-containing protein n=1 Tax=Porphyrobacter sp. CACIAM 03H1 TaxID=2003315 RepID=UPI000B5A68B6|nr:LysR family transcriptional regulator [Porphyrobacter sp. CACIAM 03H1]ASJ92373.1 hypothetical protein CBR61_16610 [Porphyrobacter sp. CACIAM 03H1]